MFCKNCGTQYEDGQAFCPACGSAAEAPEANAATMESGMKNNKLPIAIIAAAVVVLVIVIIAVASASGPEKAVKKMFKYFEKGNSEKMLALEAPKDVYEEQIDDIYDMDVDEYCEIMDAAYDALWEGLKDEGKVKISYEIKECENVDKLDKLEDDVDEGYDIGDLDDFIDAMDEEFEDYDFDADKIKKAYAVEYKYTVEVDGDKAAKGSTIVFAYKYKGDWYLTSTLSPYSLLWKLDSDDFEDVIEDVSDELSDLY